MSQVEVFLLLHQNWVLYRENTEKRCSPVRFRRSKALCYPSGSIALSQGSWSFSIRDIQKLKKKNSQEISLEYTNTSPGN